MYFSEVILACETEWQNTWSQPGMLHTLCHSLFPIEMYRIHPPRKTRRDAHMEIEIVHPISDVFRLPIQLHISFGLISGSRQSPDCTYTQYCTGSLTFQPDLVAFNASAKTLILGYFNSKLMKRNMISGFCNQEREYVYTDHYRPFRHFTGFW